MSSPNDNILAYEPKTDVAKSVNGLIGELTSAAEQWRSYGTALTIAYKAAYSEHERVLKDVELRFKTENDALLYYLFVGFVVAMSGNVAGLLIAPIITRPGVFIANWLTKKSNEVVKNLATANKFSRAAKTVSPSNTSVDMIRELRGLERKKEIAEKVKMGTLTEEHVTEQLKDKTKGFVEKFFSPGTNVPDDSSVFKPPKTDPHDFDLERRHEIDICVSLLKEHVKLFQIIADNYQIGRETATAFKNVIRESELIQKQPVAQEIEAARGETARRKAELAMWIAWASARDIHYWKERLKGISVIDRGVDYLDYQHLRKFQPIVKRLIELKVDQSTTMGFTVRDPFKHLVSNNERVLNIPALKLLGSRLNDPFLKVSSQVANSGKLTLNTLSKMKKQ